MPGENSNVVTPSRVLRLGICSSEPVPLLVTYCIGRESPYHDGGETSEESCGTLCPHLRGERREGVTKATRKTGGKVFRLVRPEKRR